MPHLRFRPRLFRLACAAGVLACAPVLALAQFTGAFALNPPAYGSYLGSYFNPGTGAQTLGGWTGTIDGFGQYYTTFGVVTYASGELQLYMDSNGFPYGTANFSFLATAPADGTISFTNLGGASQGGATYFTADNINFTSVGTGNSSFAVTGGSTVGFTLVAAPVHGSTAYFDLVNFSFTPTAAVPESSASALLFGVAAAVGGAGARWHRRRRAG
jgi:hypothetical protein